MRIRICARDCVPDSGKGGERERGGVDEGTHVVDEVLANGRSNQYRPLMRDSLLLFVIRLC